MLQESRSNGPPRNVVQKRRHPDQAGTKMFAGVARFGCFFLSKDTPSQWPPPECRRLKFVNDQSPNFWELVAPIKP